MTFGYNPSLPNPPDDPADDVYGMQQNSTSISQILAVDHVGFNDPLGGTHEQVTFNTVTPPTPPVTPPVLFVAPTAPFALPLKQLFFYSGNAIQSSLQYNNSSQGSVVLMGGMILKWGSQGLPSGASTVTFPQAFPLQCLQVFAWSIDTGSATAANTYVYARSPSASGFNALSVKRVEQTAVASTCGYFAIGY